MWIETTRSLSTAALKKGRQYSLWIDGRSSLVGLSLIVTERKPLAASRFISATVASMSQTGRMPSGMKRAGSVAHHSSQCQSL